MSSTDQPIAAVNPHFANLTDNDLLFLAEESAQDRVNRDNEEDEAIRSSDGIDDLHIQRPTLEVYSTMLFEQYKAERDDTVPPTDPNPTAWLSGVT